MSEAPMDAAVQFPPLSTLSVSAPEFLPVSPTENTIIDPPTGVSFVKSASWGGTKYATSGVTCQWLLKFCKDNDLWEYTTSEVVQKIVKPQTVDKQCRYVELLDRTDIGTPNVFVSHSWSGRFGDLVAGVNLHSSPTRLVWVDIFSVYQHDAVQMTADLGNLRLVINNSNAGVLLVVNAELSVRVVQSNPLSRTWCIYEALQSIITGRPFTVRIGQFDDITKEFVEVSEHNVIEYLVKITDVASSETSYAHDKDIILDSIKQNGYEHNDVNHTILTGLWTAYTTRTLPAFHFALQGREVLMEQIDKGIDIHEQNPEGWTVLHCAAHMGLPKVLTILLDVSFGMDKNALTNKKRTALMQASWHCATTAMQVLLDAGADPHLKDCFGNDAMHYADVASRKSELIRAEDRARAIQVLKVAGLCVPKRQQKPPRSQHNNDSNSNSNNIRNHNSNRNNNTRNNNHNSTNHSSYNGSNNRNQHNTNHNHNHNHNDNSSNNNTNSTKPKYGRSPQPNRRRGQGTQARGRGQQGGLSNNCDINSNNNSDGSDGRGQDGGWGRGQNGGWGRSQNGGWGRGQREGLTEHAQSKQSTTTSNSSTSNLDHNVGIDDDDITDSTTSNLNPTNNDVVVVDVDANKPLVPVSQVSKLIKRYSIE